MMPFKSGFGTRMAAAGLAVSTTVAAVALVAASPQAAQQAAAAVGPVPTITLVTGDRVVMSGDRPTSVEPGPGRAGVAFDIVTVRGRVNVIPSDVHALLAGGRLDP